MKPTKHPLSDLHANLPAEIDLFICCASFEQRCTKIANSLTSVTVRRAVVAEYRDGSMASAKHAEVILKKFPGAKRVDIFSSAPLRTLDNLVNALSPQDVETPRHIAVDISTFTREALLILLRVLRRTLRPDDHIHCLYVGAKQYSIGDSEEKTWLTHGVREVRSILGYPGRLLPSRQTHLIVLVGYEDERANELISSIEPSVLSLGLGSIDPIRPELATTNRLFYQKIASVFGQIVRRFEFSPSDHLVTRDAIGEQVQQHRSYNTIVAPMNTKISTIGCGLVGLDNPDLQLCYAQPEIYNERYAEPEDDYYSFELSELMITMNDSV